MFSISPIEFRMEGRTLVGTALPYGAMATRPGFTETWRRGSAVMAPNVALNIRHQAARKVAETTDRTLEIRNTAEGVQIIATPRDSAAWREALQGIEQGTLRGLSVEFRAMADLWEGDARIIERGLISGFGIVDKPAYDTTLEVRRDERIQIWL